MKELAEEKRKYQTEAESILWQYLRGKQLEDFKFRRQHIIDEFIVDFVCLSKMLIIEIDGGYHQEPEIVKADKLRTKILESLGYKVIRFKNEEIIGNIDIVLGKIEIELTTVHEGKGQDVASLFPPLRGGSVWGFLFQQILSPKVLTKPVVGFLHYMQ